MISNVALALGSNLLTAQATDVAGNQSDFPRAITRVANVVRWINPNGGDWNDPANWDTGAVPTANQDVIISLSGNFITVTHTTGTTQIKSLHLEHRINMLGGSFSVAETTEIIGGIIDATAQTKVILNRVVSIGSSLVVRSPNAEMNIRGEAKIGVLIAFRGKFTIDGQAEISELFIQNGTLTGAGDVTLTGLSGQHAWVGGVISGSGKFTIAETAILDIGRSAVGADTILNRILINDGTVILRTNPLKFRNGSMTNNGTVLIDSSNWPVSVVFDSGSNTFINNGTVIHQGPTSGTLGTNGATSLDGMTNAGTVEVHGGLLSLNGFGQPIPVYLRLDKQMERIPTDYSLQAHTRCLKIPRSQAFPRSRTL